MITCYWLGLLVTDYSLRLLVTGFWLLLGLGLGFRVRFRVLFYDYWILVSVNGS